MTEQERDLITRFIERVAGAQPQGQPLPPLDPEADKLIADLFARYPEARYRITQMAMVEEQALIQAQNRIRQLQWELQQAHQAAPPGTQGGSPWGASQQAPQPPQQSRGFFSSLFGGGTSPRPAAPPPPQAQPYGYAPPPPQYPPGYNPGMFQPQGTGFLGSALRTATGVAGGMLAADALMNLFSGHHGGWGGGPEQVVGMVPEGFTNPWGGGGGPAADPADFGGAPKEPAGDDKFAGPAQIDQADWTQAPPQDSGTGWQDASNDPGFDQGGVDQAGWDQAGDDGGGWDDIQNT